MSEKTEIVCVLDRSGSMAAMGDEPIGGFNRFLKEQKEVEGDASMTLVLFDDQYELIHNGVDLKDIPDLTSDTYFPRGMTALFDATGKTIRAVQERIAITNKEDRPDKVICVILTDGLENDSKEYKGSDLTQMVKELEDKHNWEFIFMGCSQDSFKDAKDMGLSATASLGYVKSSAGLADGYAQMSRRAVKSRTNN